MDLLSGLLKSRDTFPRNATNFKFTTEATCPVLARFSGAWAGKHDTQHNPFFFRAAFSLFSGHANSGCLSRFASEM